MSSIKMTIERERTLPNGDDVTDEFDVTIEFTYSRGCRGARDSLGGKAGAGPALEPDEPASVEIQSVTDNDGLKYTLTESEQERAEELAFAKVADENSAYFSELRDEPGE